ncbi:MAG: hypothetical protein ACRDH2_12915 [Anaerolineales bacterium]
MRWTGWLVTLLYGQLLIGTLLFMLTDAEGMPSPAHPLLGIGAVIVVHSGLSIRRKTPRAFHLWRAGFLALLGAGLWITTLHF